MNADEHVPVALEQVRASLAMAAGGVFYDLTFGRGGHAAVIAEDVGPGGRLVVFDRDPAAIEVANRFAATCLSSVTVVQADFRELASEVAARRLPRPDAVFLDAGLSSPQLDDPARGFSFRADAPLDMRMDPIDRKTAADLLAELTERDLARVFRELGEERWADSIAGAIARRRVLRPVLSTFDLNGVVERAIPRRFWPEKIHPATRVYMALRIAVNDELGALETGLRQALDLLKPGGRLAVLAYHSLEDRIVKNLFADAAGRCSCPRELPECRCGAVRRVRILTKRPVMATEAEVELNPRARSFRLRVVEKVESV